MPRKRMAADRVNFRVRISGEAARMMEQEARERGLTAQDVGRWALSEGLIRIRTNATDGRSDAQSQAA